MYKSFYQEQYSELILGDSFDVLAILQPRRFDMIFADPPYFLSNDGMTCSGGKAVSVNKGSWDKINSLKEKHDFNRRWIKLCRNVLKPNGTIWISGTLHNIYSIGMALEEEDYKILNNITWHCCPTKKQHYCWFGTDSFLKGNLRKPPFARSSEPWRNITQFFSHCKNSSET